MGGGGEGMRMVTEYWRIQGWLRDDCSEAKIKFMEFQWNKPNNRLVSPHLENPRSATVVHIWSHITLECYGVFELQSLYVKV